MGANSMTDRDRWETAFLYFTGSGLIRLAFHIWLSLSLKDLDSPPVEGCNTG
jgi:hypothetical protein